MIRLTNLADYAVVLISQLARRDTRISAADLATETGLPVPTVSKVLGALTRAGLAQSHRGLKGGFSLAQAACDITIVDVIEAVDGPIALVHCIENAPGDCELESICSMRTQWQIINAAVKDGLSRVTIADITNATPPAFALATHESPPRNKPQD